MPTYRTLLAIVFFLSLLLSGCTASLDITRSQTRLQDIADFRTVNVDSLSGLLASYRKRDEDEVLYRLEHGMLHHYLGNWDASAEHFQGADRAIERYYTKDISKNLKALLVNDFQLPYPGEPYESIYLSVFNSLNYLHSGDQSGGLVEVRRISHKLELLNDRYKGLAQSLIRTEDEEDAEKARTAVREVDEQLTDVDLLTKDDDVPVEIQQNSALGRFMATVLYAKTGAPSSARIERKQLRTALADQGRTDFLSAFSPRSGAQGAVSRLSESGADAGKEPPAPDTSATVPTERQLTSQTAYNTLLLAFSGDPPRKKEKSYQFNLLINGEHVQFNFAVPRLETLGTVVDRVRAIVAGDTLRVPLIEDMQSVAASMFKKKRPLIYTRAIMRAFLQTGATEGVEKMVEKKLGGVAGWITGQAGAITGTVLAQADTRGWQTMPGFAYATVAEVPAGTHEVIFEYLPSQDAPDTPIHVLEREGRWIVTTAALEASGGESTSIKASAEREEALFRTYADRQEAVEAGERLAKRRVPSRLVVRGEEGKIDERRSFEAYKRRHHQISVRGKRDLDIAESIYLQ